MDMHNPPGFLLWSTGHGTLIGSSLTFRTKKGGKDGKNQITNSRGE